MSDDKTGYIVRGAGIYCKCGSHKRRIDMPESHGSYTKGKPLMHKLDCITDDNIPSFGVCMSDSNPDPQKYQVTDLKDCIISSAVAAGSIQGKKCVPVIGTEFWDYKEDMIIKDNEAITINSYLTCATGGGEIHFFNDGQDN